MLLDATRMEFSGKFDAIWKGPFQVLEVNSNNRVQLATLDVNPFPFGTNAEKYKVFYV